MGGIRLTYGYSNYSRPRYAGYLRFQDHAGDPIHEYLRLGGDPRKVLGTLNRLYTGKP